MYLQIRKSVYIFIVLFTTILVGNVIADDTAAFLSLESKNAADIQKILDNFSDHKFDMYLNDTTHYGASEYHTAICNLFINYQNSYSNLNTCREKTDGIKKQMAEDTIKSVSEYPLQNILYGVRIGAYLAISNNISLKKDVLEFIVNCPELTKTFNPVMAFNDVLRACGKGGE
ncbi:MAG: hypothetical protein KKD44_01980 [Proteobacteria bacterium]|nr:hypothetical protein [Pseudomonadota bacterium]